MITLTINNVPTLFIKAFTGADVQLIMDFVRKAATFHAGDSGSAKLPYYAFPGMPVGRRSSI